MAGDGASPVLLILPSLSIPLETSSIRSAYTTTVSTLLSKLVANRQSRLDIAITLSKKQSSSPAESRAGQFPSFQQVLEEYYRLICIVAAQEKVDLDFPGGVDVRIFVLYDADPEDERVGKQALCGPFVDVQTFAASNKSYSGIYVAESEEGAEALAAVAMSLRMKNKLVPPIERLPSGPAIAKEPRAPKAEDFSSVTEYLAAVSGASSLRGSSNVRHHSVIVGGTFDHLHIGHKLLLSATVFLAEPGDPPHDRLITIGITGDELLVNKKYASQVESWDDRQASTAAFVESMLIFHPDPASVRTVEQIYDPGPNGRVVRVRYGDHLMINYTQIWDPFGPTITDEDISALIVSKETRAGGKAVNDKRNEKGWKILEVFEVDVLDASVSESDDEEGATKEKVSFEAKISSTEIRRRLQELQTI